MSAAADVPAERRPTRIAVWTRAESLDEHAAIIDDLLEHCGCPVTARRTWWRAWLDAYPQFSPWIVALMAEDDRLLALAPLARTRTRTLTQVVAIGHGASDHVRMPSRADADATGVAHAVAAHLASIQGPWSLAIRQTSLEDRVVAELAGSLPHARTIPGHPAPQTRIDERDLSAYTSRNYRKAARNRLARLERAGHDASLDIHRGGAAIMSRLDEVFDVCRTREHEMVGRSHLDDPRREAFFRGLVRGLVAEEAIELATLTVDDRIAAYQVNLIDHGTYRSWNGHHSPAWADFSPGHILDSHVLQRVIADESLDAIDWMMGLESYKLRVATHTYETQNLLAASSATVQKLSFAPQLLRARLEHAAAHSRRAAETLGILRRTRQRMRRLRR